MSTTDQTPGDQTPGDSGLGNPGPGDSVAYPSVDQHLPASETNAAALLPPRPVRFSNPWDRFWFTPTPNTVITAIRFTIGLVCFVWAISWLPDLETWLGERAIVPGRTRYFDGQFGLFRYWETDTSLYLVYGVLILSSLCLMLGQYVKVAAVLVWYTVMSMQFESSVTSNAADGLLRIWTFYFALFAILTPSRFLSTPLLGLRGPDGKRTWPVAPAWILRIMQVQLSIIYVATVIAKMPGNKWIEGTASQYALGLEDFQRMWIPEFVRQSPWLGNLMTWSAFGIEIALPFLLWTKRTRRLGLLLGLGMHAAFDYSMRLGFFFPALIIGYLAFFESGELARPLRWIGKRLDRNTGQVPIITSPAVPDLEH